MARHGVNPGRPGPSLKPAVEGEWVVLAAEVGCRLDAFVTQRTNLRSRRRIRWAIERGKLILNGRDVLPEQVATVLQAGDRVRLWADRPGSARVRRRGADVAGRALSVVYEDASVIVVNKPAGLLTVPLSRRAEASSVEELLMAHLRSKGKRRPWVVHRIDRDTSGLVVFAATLKARNALKEQFARREPERIYLALVRGTPEPPGGVWRDYVRWDSTRLAQIATHTGDPRGRECVSEYHVLESFRAGEASLIRVRLSTGRRNQIRVQAQMHGHPLLGEQQYADGTRIQKAGTEPRRQALHAWRLRFTHPETGRPLDIEAPVPSDLELALSHLRAADKQYNGPSRNVEVKITRKYRKVGSNPVSRSS